MKRRKTFYTIISDIGWGIGYIYGLSVSCSIDYAFCNHSRVAKTMETGFDKGFARGFKTV